MWIRRFIFSPDRQGQIDFRLCYEAFRMRDPAKCTGEERRHLAQIQRALEAISVPIGEDLTTDDQVVDGRFRKLQVGGGVAEIPVKAYERLETIIAEAPLMAGVSLQIDELKDRLAAADKAEVEKTPPLLPAPGETPA